METTLKSMRYFMAAVDCGSITEASKKMHVVPSAVLAAVNQVEASFGLKLTIRNRAKGISLTATGQALSVKIQHLLDEYDSVKREGIDLKTHLTGTLRVGYYAPVAPTFMPGIIKDLIRDSENVDVKFYECDNQSAQSGLISGAYDVIICVAGSMKPEISYDTLLEVPPYCLVSESHPFAGQESVSVKQLAKEKLVLLDLPVVSEYYSGLFESAGIEPNIVSTATTVEMVRSLVGAGLGSSILHMRPATTLTYAGERVVAVPLKPAFAPLKIVLGHHAENPRRLVKAFVDALQGYFMTSTARQLIVPLNS